MEFCLTNYDTSFRGGIGDYVETVVVAFHDLDFGVSFFEICWHISQENRYIVFRMSGCDCIEHRSSDVASRAGTDPESVNPFENMQRGFHT